MAIISEMLSLPRKERLKCMEELWDSLRSDELDSPDWHKTVLDERKASVDSGQANFLSAAELKARLNESK
ncbi:MAG: addiction module protein [Verrucomicrobiales bacterium]|nr:addiction module protein [Verrucomicrobiales bacterium]